MHAYMGHPYLLPLVDILFRLEERLAQQPLLILKLAQRLGRRFALRLGGKERSQWSWFVIPLRAPAIPPPQFKSCLLQISRMRKYL